MRKDVVPHQVDASKKFLLECLKSFLLINNSTLDLLLKILHDKLILNISGVQVEGCRKEERVGGNGGPSDGLLNRKLAIRFTTTRSILFKCLNFCGSLGLKTKFLNIGPSRIFGCWNENFLCPCIWIVHAIILIKLLNWHPSKSTDLPSSRFSDHSRRGSWSHGCSGWGNGKFWYLFIFNTRSQLRKLRLMLSLCHNGLSRVGCWTSHILNINTNLIYNNIWK